MSVSSIGKRSFSAPWKRGRRDYADLYCNSEWTCSSFCYSFLVGGPKKVRGYIDGSCTPLLTTYVQGYHPLASPSTELLEASCNIICSISRKRRAVSVSVSSPPSTSTHIVAGLVIAQAGDEAERIIIYGLKDHKTVQVAIGRETHDRLWVDCFDQECPVYCLGHQLVCSRMGQESSFAS